MQRVQQVVDVAADGAVAGQSRDMAGRIVGLGADVEVERGELDACAVAYGDVQFVAVIFLNDGTGIFTGFGWQVFPILNQDNVAQVFFTAGFEQRVVMVGRDNGNNQIGLPRDFAEAGVGGNACDTAVSKIDGGNFALI